MKWTLRLVFGLLFAGTVWAGDRPNVVWIVAEDCSKHYFHLFDEAGAETPHIADLASSGIVYRHAFSESPVCSVARTTLATGCHAPRIGTQYHRRAKMAELSEGLRLFPWYLRQAGYYTSNNRKKDYNAVEGKGVWDESSGKAHWRNRPDDEMPFFHMQSHSQSHESSLHFSVEDFKTKPTEHDPAQVKLPPYFPDTPLFRYTYARYLDNIHTIDDIVGETVAMLEEDGLLEDTFVFFFGDHGGVLPRSKGYIYESGVHVPLVVRVPEKWKHLVDGERGSDVSGFVSFSDFGPTVLRLAGVDVPEQMDGRPFLGQGVAANEVARRDTALSFADRFDEKYDLVRAIRVGTLKYIRNYQGYYPDGLRNNYRYRMLAYAEWRDLFRDGKLGSEQRAFFEPKPAEALYDLAADPHETTNLADSDEHRETLLALRASLQARLREMPDLSFLPENVLVAEAMNDPVAFGRKNRERIARAIETADLAVLPFPEARGKLVEALRSTDPVVRQWAATVCACFGKEAGELVGAVVPLIDDPDPVVRIRAAEFLGIIGQRDPRPTLRSTVEETNDPLVVLLGLQSAVYFHDHAEIAYPFRVSDLTLRVKEGEFGRRIEYLQAQER